VGSWGYGDDGKYEEEEDDGREEPRASHQVAGEELWWENGSQHYRATHLSGHVTGLGLSRLCITPSTRLKNLCSTIGHHYSDLTNHIPIIISSLSFFSALFLSL